MKSKIISSLLAVFAFTMFAPSIFGQATGGLSGTVTDPNGAVVQGVNVTVKNTGTNLTRNAVTNEDGRWTLTLLPVGSYTVSFDKEGFKKSSVSNVAVEASVTR
jgi:Carboxypeptidase regulatory-like domain